MELSEKNINDLASVLKQKDLEKSLKKVQDYSEIAKQLIEKYPELSADEIGEIYEQQMSLESQNKDEAETEKQ